MRGENVGFVDSGSGRLLPTTWKADLEKTRQHVRPQRAYTLLHVWNICARWVDRRFPPQLPVLSYDCNGFGLGTCQYT